MSEKDLLKRITSNPGIFGGKPIVRGMRISVEMILGLLSKGASHQEILDDYPSLEADDIFACLSYARSILADEEIEALNIDRRA